MFFLVSSWVSFCVSYGQTTLKNVCFSNSKAFARHLCCAVWAVLWRHTAILGRLPVTFECVLSTSQCVLLSFQYVLALFSILLEVVLATYQCFLITFHCVFQCVFASFQLLRLWDPLNVSFVAAFEGSLNCVIRCRVRGIP